MKRTLLFATLFIFYGCHEDPRYTFCKEAIAKIEEFKKQRNRVPQTLEEIGLTINRKSRLVYEPIGKDHFRIFYDVGHWRLYTYSSTDKKWVYGY